MRIIGGKYRGKNLISPGGAQVRPTSDRAREALFSILRSKLGFDFSGYKLLDVFAGSGAFGLEALSQGFSEIALVDKEPLSLQKNVRLFPAEASRIEVFKADACFIPKAKAEYDVLVMEAPYRQNLTEPALRELAAKNWLKNGALCLVEIHKDEKLNLPEQFEQTDERRYGLAKVIFAKFKAV